MKKVHAEIEYFNKEGKHWVHSDICPPNCSNEHLDNKEWRQFLHDCLDEWLEKSNGSGIFYIKEDGYEIK